MWGRGDAGEKRLFVCNNDNTIKVYNLLGDMHAPVTSVRCPTPINYAALSKGLGLLACVGDCPKTMLYKATESGEHTLPFWFSTLKLLE